MVIREKMENHILTTISGKPLTYSVSVRVPISIYQELINLTKKQGISLSDVLNEFILAGLKRIEEDDCDKQLLAR